MLSGIYALLVGAFLIYNATLRFRGAQDALRYRHQWRGLGASRGAVTGAFLLEAGLFGTLGYCGLHCPWARLLAAGAVGIAFDHE